MNNKPTDESINLSIEVLELFSLGLKPSHKDLMVGLDSAIAGLRELQTARQRIAELEAKLANPVLLPKTNGYWTEQEKAYEEAITLAKRQVRLAGFRCEGDE